MPGFRRHRQERHVGLHCRIQVGGRATPVGTPEPVSAVMRYGDPSSFTAPMRGSGRPVLSYRVTPMPRA